MYNTTMSMVLIIPVILLGGEIPAAMTYKGTTGFWVMMYISGILGFLINIAVFLQIKVTSPLTSSIVGTTKSCLQTFLSVLIFGNTITLLNVVGIILTIGGSFWYSRIRYFEMRKGSIELPTKAVPSEFDLKGSVKQV